ncbi:GlxA family transcriptional regulator [Salinicola aestuarinus]|uniref:GlxA family transcriptional regulator n=1 Tax=Salinicola aestuarinus TaxID=1949082 RepID=UPI001FD9C1F2|nr:GlxA family transcriptional regulator [Salinicola aestuarinus]
MSRDVPRRVGFLLLPGFSLLAQACAIEPLIVANRLAGGRLYAATTLAVNTAPVVSVSELALTPDAAAGSDEQPLDAVIVCAPLVDPASDAGPTSSQIASLLAWLARLAQRGVALGGIAGGTRWLAQAGVLEGYRASIPYAGSETFARRHPAIRVSHQLFEIDRDRFTCGGGTAAMDMMMTLIGQQHGDALARRVSEHFVCERIRMADEPQQVPLQSGLGQAPTGLLDAVALMEANIEEPLTTHELSAHLGMSRRQLERLFKKHLQAVPSRFYLNLRLQRARRALRETDSPVGDIALAHGFSSGAHFSTAYRHRFGISPRDERLGG